MNISLQKSLIYLLLVCSVAGDAGGFDMLNPSRAVHDGESLISAGGTFELGFFSCKELGLESLSTTEFSGRYLGIWFRKIPIKTVVWVANRSTPISDSSGVLKVTDQGSLILQVGNGTGLVVWSSNSTATASKPVAQLLDSGNLVIRALMDGNWTSNFIWQSFDYPFDTLLTGMKLGRNRTSGFDRYLTSWNGDPSSGNFTLKADPTGYPQLVVRQGSEIKFSSGPWNGVRFSGTPYLNPNPYYQYEIVLNDEEMYYHYEVLDNTLVSRLTLSPNGLVQRFTWIERTQKWKGYLSSMTDNCDTYALCGAHGSCSIHESPECRCLEGFKPKFPEEWEKLDWSNGCVRRISLDCPTDEFVKYSGIRFPDSSQSWFNKTMNLEECKACCKRNCSCAAYSSLDIREGGTGCLLWFGDLVNIRELDLKGQDLFIRMSVAESAFFISRQRRKLFLRLGPVLAGLFLASGLTATATNKFSSENKLGQGGYGPVYKGVLKNGQEIAVKKLAANSRQGLDEFKNEVLYIAQLQHRNLVKLLGCYEELGLQLDWSKRFHIIDGIARGLLYLHQDSRLRIIHRDLKAGNILLDYEMNPKISDFGLAKNFGEDETEANTNRVVGTHGYISPEYATDGTFSMKSDVFSFGVLTLETVSGHRNRGFFHPEHCHNLSGHAWKLFTEGRSLELLSPAAGNLYDKVEVLRSITVGLLCVQRSPEDRPSMSKVVLMLESDIELPFPGEPGFFNERNSSEGSSSTHCPSTNNEHMVTLPYAR
ncbi:hypothetical protein MLD38_001949 [Melastoma candidum]|uniref:Uncharacterized protein n=1 Tax=Melastoma candidum TaxID=119954 RepID=A0ACB9SES7_9MYRT|nr:hypothetical protein MLD38_001949 [Melastoma candidum]